MPFLFVHKRLSVHLPIDVHVLTIHDYWRGMGNEWEVFPNISIQCLLRYKMTYLKQCQSDVYISIDVNVIQQFQSHVDLFIGLPKLRNVLKQKKSNLVSVLPPFT